jgi:hypothetical protein
MLFIAIVVRGNGFQRLHNILIFCGGNLLITNVHHVRIVRFFIKYLNRGNDSDNQKEGNDDGMPFIMVPIIIQPLQKFGG